MSENITFMFSKALDNPDKFFQGYCFQGRDYVEGEEGARRYFQATGMEILPGQDGCYVSVIRKGSDFQFSTDYSGNKKIFYFWSPTFWAVSNSFVSLIDHLKCSDIRVHVNPAQLRSIGVGGRSSVFNQLTSYSTSAAGVFLAPALSALSIGPLGVRLASVGRQLSKNYQDALSDFCRIWVERIRTLAAAEISLSSDLTGGADSRAVLSLILAAGRKLGAPQERLGIRSGSVGEDTTDLEIATEICGELDLPLNIRSGGRRRLSPLESYAAWRELCLGAYHPIYFPRYSMGTGTVSFGGGGAENHRRFYKNTSFQALIERCAARVGGGACSSVFRKDMQTSVELLGELYDGALDPLIVHYRNFRHRFHTGRSPQHAIVFSPLGSSYLERASEVAGQERISAGQVGYDIMFSLSPELLDFRFDREEKELTAHRRGMLTPVDFEVDGVPGKAYVGEAGEQGEILGGRAGRPIDLLWDEVSDVAASQVVEDFWGKAFTEEVVATVEQARDRGRFAHAVDGQNASALLMSGVIL